VYPQASTADCTDTVAYQPPEELSSTTTQGLEKAVDFWQLGILLYEMLVGAPPFQADGDREALANRILTQDVFGEKGVSKTHKRGSVAVRASTVVDSADYVHAKLFITQLTVKDPLKRLGSESAQQLKDHAFFRETDWEAVAGLKCPQTVKPPKRKLSASLPSSGGVELSELALDPRDSFAPMQMGFEGFDFEES
jgi:serine/threonine protein kinase